MKQKYPIYCFIVCFLHTKNKAFTLIELLVVVLIIGILAAIAVPQYQKAVQKSRLAEALVLVKAVADAQRRHFLANGEYTIDFESLDIDVSGGPANAQTGSQTKKVGNNLSLQLRGEKGLKAGNGFYVMGGIMNAAKDGTPLAVRWMPDEEALVCTAYGTDQSAIAVCKTFGKEIPCPATIATSGYNFTCISIN
ncbi:PilE-like protein [Elusimicrobium minutum Pei191]|uniref:PilE-like protein n=1 Tax=Elusimicrobium minutum (strain Pei191) TaxID=445932 RepID=B2KAN7_ELUMP|nr:prepilin-type N-terminal cleavage/methylation domain-containing protein [Elusimicrobium minutum]ACC97583.1 PilE-like protein [Elusimicrobium minutum Pei191]